MLFLLSFLVIRFKGVAYSQAIRSQENSISEEVRQVLIHQAFQNFSPRRPPGWSPYRSRGIAGNSPPQVLCI